MRILIAAGGTGGHLFPAIRLIEEIKSYKLGRVLLATSPRKHDRDILEEKNLKFSVLPLVPLCSKGPLGILNFSIRLIAGTVKSGYLLLRFRPSVVVGFGSYISGPILLLSVLAGVKTIIHEQNVYPGKTNRVLARFVDKIAVNFPETRDYLKRFESKIVVSGSPLRRELRKSRRTGDDFTVLVMGGSQGAHILNRLIPEAIALIDDKKRSCLDIVHIAGYREKDEVMKAYRDKKIKGMVLSFTNEMHRFYNESDFVIARAGAMTVSELLYLAKPSILIPYPHAGNHQHLNARILERKGGAVLLEEGGLTAEGLRNVILDFMNRERLNNMSDMVDKPETKEPCDILIKEIAG